jgi:undecaprenyl diphosphate synthase
MMRHDICFNAIGRLEELPEHVRIELADVTTRTSGNRGLRLNLAINYGGRAELVDAVKSLIQDEVEVTEQAISARLYTAGQPDPDLLIRTSGEMRISNFLLWQIAYAELYVTETLWPDFTRAELLRAILDYQKRDRRYGGLGSSEAGLLDGSLEPVGLPAQ